MVGQQRRASSGASQVFASGNCSGRFLRGRKRRESLVSCCRYQEDYGQRVSADSYSGLRGSRAQGPSGSVGVKFSPHFILTAWDHRTEKVKVKIDRKLISLPLQVDPSVLERERLAVLAKDAANVSEFRVTGSLRTSWYEAQRRDPSLAGSLRRAEPPMRIAGDGLLERDVTLRTKRSCGS